MKLEFRQTAPLIAGTLALALVSLTPYARSQSTGHLDADALVLQLRGLPAELYMGPMSRLCNPAPAPCSPSPLPPAEIKRQRIYSQLPALGSASVPALARGLQHADASVRSNAALALYVLSDGSLSSDRIAPRVDILAALPALVKLLSSDDEGLRNSACIGLGGIGSSARSALPQLERALADPSYNVRGFARLAIAKINGSVLP
jgi:hypothetical protein